MTQTSNLRLAAALILAIGIPASIVAGCSSGGSNPTPTTVVYNTDSGTDGKSTSSSSSTSPSTSTDGGGPDATVDGSDGQSPAPDGEPQEAATDAQPACTPVLTEAGCWVCPAQTTTSNEFLNQCYGTGVLCSPYDNFTNIPGYDGGPLVWTN